MMKVFVFLTLLALASCSPLLKSEIAESLADPTINYFLPTNAIPNSYKLIVEPNFTNFTFDGSVEINVDVISSTNNITFHAKNITFKNTTLTGDSGRITIIREENDLVRDFRILHLATNIPSGRYTIQITYSGLINEWQANGFYKSYYTNSAGITRWIAATHFEPTHARQAFPCFDEPALKANFTVHIRRQADYNSISNMPLLTTIRENGYYEDIFQSTDKMSTYLLAFAVTDFKNISEGRQRLFARADAIYDGEGIFSLDMGEAVLRAFELHTGVNYTLPKMDQIAMPHFSAGAMENWGLVVYRQTALLYSNVTSTTAHKESVLSIIAHEFAHQWFGDLVSPLWWKYLWLNEGFASIYDPIIRDQVKPDWRVLDRYALTLQNLFNTDGVQNTRPMTSDVYSPAEIRSIFDSISYGKSACVIRMLQHAITDRIFREGIKIYLLNRSFAAADSDDLWNGLQKALDQNNKNLSISLIMRSWENQKGYPIIHVRRNYADGLAEITQERYLNLNATHNDTTRWFIPINYATSNNFNFSETAATDWINPNSSYVLKTGAKANDWLIVNKQQTGYYRVNYDNTNWNLIATYLNTSDYDKIHPINRAQLINDAFSLAKSRRLNYSVALQLTNYLDRETDYVPLHAFFNILGEFTSIAAGAQNYSLFEKRLENILDKAVAELGIRETGNSDKEHVNNLNRIDIINKACEWGNKRCFSLAIQALNNIHAISVDLQRVVLCSGIRNAPEYLWREIHKQSSNASLDTTLRANLNNALGCSHNESILSLYLDAAVDQKLSVFSNIYSKGSFGVQYIFKYILNNFENIYSKLGGTETGLQIRQISGYLKTNEQLRLLKELQASNKHPDVVQNFILAVNNVENSISAAKEYWEDITSWIQNTLA